jgi:methylphosphotriester-DNA--protein-cysteine methyltransferase
VDATRPADGVELFRARLRGRPFSRHRHDVYAIGVTEERVEAGFADEAHFTRTFKAAFGMTPGRYTRLCTAYSQLRPNAMPVRLQLLR